MANKIAADAAILYAVYSNAIILRLVYFSNDGPLHTCWKLDLGSILTARHMILNQVVFPDFFSLTVQIYKLAQCIAHACLA